MGTWIVNVLSKLEVNVIFRIQPPLQTNISGHMFVLIFLFMFLWRTHSWNLFKLFEYTLYIATMLKC
jgi:hypothetical protein